ncbi:MAG TPA: thioredoxin family protein [Trebonia sp.]
MAGLIVLAVALALACATGFGLRLRQGRFSFSLSRTDAADSAGPPASGSVLTASDLGAPLGRRGTLVQFSTEFCSYCGPTRELLTEMARTRDGLAFVEIDADDRIDLARRLRVFTTPTVLVLAADGTIAGRAAGQPRRSDVLAAVGSVLGEDGAGQ